MSNLNLSDKDYYIKVIKIFNISDEKHMALVCETNNIHAEGYIKVGNTKNYVYPDWSNTDNSKSYFYTTMNNDIKIGEQYFIEK